MMGPTGQGPDSHVFTSACTSVAAPEETTGEDGKDRAISAAVVRHQDEFTGRGPRSNEPVPPSELTVFRNVRSPSSSLTEKALTAPVVVPLKLEILVGDIEMVLSGLNDNEDGFVADTLVGDGLSV